MFENSFVTVCLRPQHSYDVSLRITRNMAPSDKDSIHVFSSHFFTTLVDEGTEGVSRWTAKRGIDIFKKKFVFIPINEALHWSLCVVVNPGAIENNDLDEEEGPLSCLLFLDSLKAHRKKKVFNRVKEWLQAEWNRINQSKQAEDGELFMDRKTFKLLDPKSKSLVLLRYYLFLSPI